jgi:glycosyltransferase involved in cell wall biosynthesis
MFNGMMMEKPLPKCKIAIVHEWFTTLGGSEKVIEQLLKIFPNADLFSLFDFLPEKDRAFLGSTKVQTTFLQTMPFINHKNYRTYLPFMPLAVEQINLSEYDVIISNCHAVSKGVITSPEQLHIGYIHTPMRYAWDMQNAYLENSGLKNIKGAVARVLLHYIRNWDVIASMRPDRLLANSSFIAKRVRKIYRRDSHVLYPPVDTDYFTANGPREDFYLAASRFVPYKRVDLIAEAFRGIPDKKLIIIGDGPELPRVKHLFGENVTWLGYQPADVLRDHLQRCKAFIFAAKEDFGIMPLEAQACGAPVIAFGEGGATETVRGQGCSSQTGVFFNEQSVPALQAAILEFEALNIKADDCRANAELFSNQRFQREFLDFVTAAWNDFQKPQ